MSCCWARAKKLFQRASGCGGESKSSCTCCVFSSSAQAGLEAPGRVEDVLVAVAQLEPRPGVGGVAHAGLDVLRRGLDHRDAQRRGVGEQRMGVDVGLHAGEIAAFQQAALVGDDQVAVVGRARADRAQVLGHRVGVALQAGDAHRAEAERRAARQLDLEPRLARPGIDHRAAVGDARRGVAPARQLARRQALGRVPVLLAERLAAAQAPAARAPP